MRTFPPPRDEAGQALSAFVATMVLALLLVAGLVVDGGAKVSATRRVHAAAAVAARAAVDAGAVARAAGAPVEVGALQEAAAGTLTERGVDGSVSVEAGRVHVRAHTSTPTVFLSLIGITELEASGEAVAELRTP